jgi:hypothetical protein
MEAAAREPVRWDLERQRDSADWTAREREARAAKRRAMVGSCMVVVVVFFLVGLERVGVWVGGLVRWRMFSSISCLYERQVWVICLGISLEMPMNVYTGDMHFDTLSNKGNQIR